MATRAQPRWGKTPGGFEIPPHAKLPESWAKVGTVDAANRPIAWDANMTVLHGPEGKYHPEKAVAVQAEVGGQPLTVIGGGLDYTEDLKELAARTIERREQEMLQARKGEEEAARLRFQKHFESKLALHKANPRSFPDPGHTKPYHGKRVF